MTDTIRQTKLLAKSNSLEFDDEPEERYQGDDNANWEDIKYDRWRQDRLDDEDERHRQEQVDGTKL